MYLKQLLSRQDTDLFPVLRGLLIDYCKKIGNDLL